MSDPPVPPVDAATVILVRHGVPVGSPWQCLMVRRHVRSEFAPAVYVFPGGKVDESDRDARLKQMVAPHDRSGTAAHDLSFRVAAIRELFEEAGVLLAFREDEGPIRFDEDEERFEGYRKEMREGLVTLGQLAEREGLLLAVDRLHPFSRWITPDVLPRRYDTRFYVAFMPQHQKPLHDAVETTDSVWISPKVALARFREGSFPLVFATEKHLESMARFPSIEGMIAATGASDLQPVMPKIVKRGEETHFLLPGDEGY